MRQRQGETAREDGRAEAHAIDKHRQTQQPVNDRRNIGQVVDVCLYYLGKPVTGCKLLQVYGRSYAHDDCEYCRYSHHPEGACKRGFTPANSGL